MPSISRTGRSWPSRPRSSSARGSSSSIPPGRRRPPTWTARRSPPARRRPPARTAATSAATCCSRPISAALAETDRYTLVRTFGDGRLLLYEVAPPERTGARRHRRPHRRHAEPAADRRPRARHRPRRDRVIRLRRAGRGSRVPAPCVLLASAWAWAPIAVLPDLVRPIQDILGLEGEPLGRLVTVLVVTVAIALPAPVLRARRAPSAPTSGSAGSSAPLSAAQIEAGRPGGEARRRARLHPGVRRGGQPAGGPRRDPARRSRASPTHVLVIDDGSRDATAAVAARHAAPTSSATPSTAARARRSRPATSSPSGSAWTSS